MSKKHTESRPEASAASEPVSEPLFADSDLAEAEKRALERYANKAPSTPYAEAYADKPAETSGMTADELVEVGLKTCGETSSAGLDARRSVLESVAAMILASK